MDAELEASVPGRGGRQMRRQGNVAQHIHVYHLLMRDSVEESILSVLRSKDRTQTALLRALKSRSRV